MYFLFAMLIPPASIIFPVYYGLRMIKIYNTLLAVILVEICYWLGFSTFLLSNVLKAFPKDLIDAAMVDGASQKTIIFRIVFPLTTSTLSTLLTIFFVWSWNSFFFPLTLTISNRLFTMPLGLLYFINTFQINEGAILASAAVVSIPMIVFFIIFQRRITSGVMAGGLKG
jgi:raffinose/stachyose/melibiose transport system permease protein